MVEVRFYDTVNDELLKFAVIISQSNGKWVFCKHKERDTVIAFTVTKGNIKQFPYFFFVNHKSSSYLLPDVSHAVFIILLPQLLILALWRVKRTAECVCQLCLAFITKPACAYHPATVLAWYAI